jgi:DNA end-binding protein Ku
MPGAFWSGTLSFGLVTIPVRLVSAVRSRGSPFHLLHDADHARLTQVMVCPAHAAPVPKAHQARGYEIDAGTYVLVSDAELESVAPESSRSIEIEDFVSANAIDLVYYDRPYYLVPRDDASKPYRLLVQTLADTGRVGIGRLVLRGREHLAALQTVDGALCLFTLHWAEAVRPRAELAPDTAAGPEQVAAMTEALDALATQFDPDALDDPMRERLEALVADKRAESGTVAARQPEVGTGEDASGEPGDLMAALKDSLEKARREGRPQRETADAAAAEQD